MAHSPGRFFDIEKISRNYELVIADFDRINGSIRSARDKFDWEVAGNMLHAYNYMNNLLAASQEQAFLSWQAMLELNFIVHLGIQSEAREEYYGFVLHTQEKVLAQLSNLMKWRQRHEHDDDDVYKIAAGLYVRILSNPQLFVEGNHRTGSLITNYYLLMHKKDPFVLTPQNAIEFFDLASDVKFQRQDIGSKFKRAIGWHDELTRMRAFLESNVRPFTTAEKPNWTRPPHERPGDNDVVKTLRRRKEASKLL